MARTAGRWEIWREVVWRPILAVIGGIYAAGAAFAFIRDTALPVFLSPRDAKTWQANLAPEVHFDWYWWVIGILVGLLIVVFEGVFRVVQKERTNFATERQKLTDEIQRLQAERQAPDFRLEVGNTMTGPSPEQPSRTEVMTVVTVTNLGAPSITDNWQVYVTRAGVRRNIYLSTIVPNTRVTDPAGQQFMLQPADAIFEKTSTVPIQTGARARGWLRYVLDGLPAKEFPIQVTSIEVTCQDVLHRTYSAQAGMDSVPAGYPYYQPGSIGPQPIPPIPGSNKPGKKKK